MLYVHIQLSVRSAGRVFFVKSLSTGVFIPCRVSTIKKFPTDMMHTLRMMIIKDPLHFLRLSRIKQALLVDKMVQRMVSRELIKMLMFCHNCILTHILLFCRLSLCMAYTLGCSLRRSFILWALWLRL